MTADHESTLSDIEEEGDAISTKPLTPFKRTRIPNRRIFGEEWVNFSICLTPGSRTMFGTILPCTHDDLFLHSLDWDAPFRGSYAAFEPLNALHIDPVTNETEWFHPFTLGAKATSEDTPTLREIQRLSPAEMDKGYDSMDVELNALRKKETFVEINRSEVPHGKQIIKSTWAHNLS